MPPAFRTAVPADAPAIVALAQSAYRGEGSRRGWTTEAHLLDGQRIDAEMVVQLIGAAGSEIWLAEDEGGALLGCVHIEAAGEAANLGLLAVAPSLQAAGLGRALLAWGERRVREAWGSRTVVLKVIHSRRELIAWYVRRGYRPTGETAPFPDHDERFGRPLAADLHFVVLAKPLAP